MSSDAPLTDLLHEWSQGRRDALDRLMPLVIAELRKLARGHLRREAPGHTLQPTALINEVYLRLAARQNVHWRARTQFFAFASRTMRRILVDHARARRAFKRGAGAAVAFDASLRVARSPVDILALDELLSTLSALDERQAHLVELRIFAGLTIAEAADVLGVAEATVSRDWASARAWLARELKRT
jgi:RNA polymerase sigma factor (TIGR02999 family)